MSAVGSHVDLTQVPAVPWAWVDEHVYAAIRGCSVKTLQNERRLNVGCPFKRVNGTSIRYRIGDITAFLESQPGGGGRGTGGGAGHDAGRGTGHDAGGDAGRGAGGGAGREAAPQTNQRKHGVGRPRKSST
jgi:hypothetical protein